MKWREFITDTYAIAPKQADIASKPEFFPGASEQEIAEAESSLDTALSVSHRSLLQESNGVMGLMAIDGGEWFAEHWLIWKLVEVVERNLWFRSDIGMQNFERDFRKVLFFADAGADGILFGFPVTEARKCGTKVLVWHPIDDQLDDIATSLDDFVEKWLTNTIWV